MAHKATRRSVLAAAMALPLAAAGCRGIGGLGTPPRPLPDVAVLRDAIAGETRLISRYTAILAAVPTMAATLRPILDQHQAHLARLKARLVLPGAAGGASPSPRESASRLAGQVPGTPAAAQAYLRGAEQGAAQALLRHLVAASPSLAQLLASIAASESTHALLLDPHRRPG